MTAAGSSSADALHKIYDRTAYALGLGGSSGDTDAQSNDSESEKPIKGPGNHPKEAAARKSTESAASTSKRKSNKAEYAEDTDTHIDEAGASAGGSGGLAKARNSISQIKGRGDALERALGENGPVGDFQNAKLGRELENDVFVRQGRQEEAAAAAKSAKEDEADGAAATSAASKTTGDGEETTTTTAGTDADPPDNAARSTAQKAKEKLSLKKKGSSETHNDGADRENIVTQQHPNQKGPKWASQPDDEQREKIKRLTAERQGRFKTTDSIPRRAWARLRRKSSSAADTSNDGEQSNDGDEGHPSGVSKETLEALGEIGGSANQKPLLSSRSGKQDSQSKKKSGKEKASSSDSPENAPKASAQPKAKDETAIEGSSKDEPFDQNSKMVKISKLMMTQDSQADGDATSEDAQKGVDGVPMTSESCPSASARWGAIRQRLRESAMRKGKAASQRKSRVVGQMSVVTELQTGVLPVFMLKMAFERDEQGHRRVPVLLNHLHLRISDSVNPLHATSAVFRIELEYGDGLIRWVCYRSLRDFINLHTHYRAAAIKGYLGRPVGAAEGDVGVPSFPRTSLPYFNQLQRQNRGKSGELVKARFAQAQRTALEDYLLELIKRTMFRPEANRICKFFELSALSVSLAARGGYQGKQGYLRIMSRSSRKDAQRGILTPVSFARSHEPKWFIVRESYVAIVEQPDSLQVFDVFLIDNAFEIVRPKRLYKQTLHLAQELKNSDKKTSKGDDDDDDDDDNDDGNDDNGDDNDNEGDKNNEKGHGKAGNGIQKSKATQGKDETAILTEGHFRDPKDDEYSGAGRKSDTNVSSHTFYVKNNERKLKLVANNERQMNQFIASMERVANRNIFGRANRFGSFAPIRLNCNAQWLVDGRDYFWQVSRALLRAKDRIMIHDWWLSPELYLRRPGTPKYRLDNILKKKAQEGVKIFVIVYNEVSNNFTPTDSNYTKQRLIGLHSNIFVQRSPSHFQTGTFYWAHHEKMCVIDETVAFMGGLDLCFGRWDTSEHVLTDNDAGNAQGKAKNDPNLIGPGAAGQEFFVWPGQDFANERVMEWHDLTKPENDLFDREHFPRMPWHDVALQIIGQPARDLCRHFTQRWNYLLRIKNHTRLMPFLIPPPDFQASELKRYDLTGTCEAQICRSAGPWSMGTSSTVEHSIQNAYLKAIQLSDHFVYIENQFFVTSTEVRGTVVENQIGEALVSRIIRAHREGTPWKAIIVIPLIPGFPMPIDHPDASSVRLIVDLQYRSISRGEHSIFGKLRRRGIDPADYIVFCSLRQWGKLPSGRLTTEQVYIHAKAMVVDDRLAIIGSANINERSQRGDRDSELACVVRDTDMIDSRMAGKPYRVGRFAHSLRVRLMREHLGLDVDAIDEEALHLQDVRPKDMLDDENEWDPHHEQGKPDRDGKIHQTNVSSGGKMNGFARTAKEFIGPVSDGAGRQVRDEAEHLKIRLKADEKKATNASGAADAAKQNGDDRAGILSPPRSGEEVSQSLDERIKSIGSEKQSSSSIADKVNVPQSGAIVPTIEEQHLLDEHKDNKGEEMRKSMSQRMSGNPWSMPSKAPEIDAEMFIDPLDERFYKDMWLATAIHNTQIFRKVFKSVPDDTVTTWPEYKAFQAWSDRLSRSGGDEKSRPPPSISEQQTQNATDSQGDVKGGNTEEGGDLSGNPSVEHAKQHKGEQNAPGAHAHAPWHSYGNDSQGKGQEQHGKASHQQVTGSGGVTPNANHSQEKFSKAELDQMEKLLEQLQGTLVLFSTRFLESEDRSDNFLFPMDKINPLNVYD